MFLLFYFRLLQIGKVGCFMQKKKEAVMNVVSSTMLTFIYGMCSFTL